MSMNHAAIAANRFGLGARSGDLEKIAPGPQAWLLDQLQGPSRAHATIAALLAGGAVNGGRVVCDWPGLAQKDLYENRDLYPSLDIRGVFKSILVEHLDLAPAFVEQVVFPDSLKAAPLENIVGV